MDVATPWHLVAEPESCCWFFQYNQWPFMITTGLSNITVGFSDIIIDPSDITIGLSNTTTDFLIQPLTFLILPLAFWYNHGHFWSNHWLSGAITALLPHSCYFHRPPGAVTIYRTHLGPSSKPAPRAFCRPHHSPELRAQPRGSAHRKEDAKAKGIAEDHVNILDQIHASIYIWKSCTAWALLPSKQRFETRE